jgi:predicted membrane chloride channel (bestrophin family)
MLEDAKRSGNVLARMKGDLLTFVKGRLSQESYEEIVMSAIAMAEAARRQKRKSDIVDIASAIGDFASSDGKHVIEGGAGGS